MYKEIGKWFLDVAKYIVTAYVLTTMFVKVDSIFAALGAIVIMVIMFAIGVYFLHKDNDNEKKIRKGEISMDAGLLSMYIALMLLGLGMIVFSKIEDNKKGK